MFMFDWSFTVLLWIGACGEQYLTQFQFPAEYLRLFGVSIEVVTNNLERKKESF